MLDFVNPVRPGRHGLAEDRLTKCELYVLKESAQPRVGGRLRAWVIRLTGLSERGGRRIQALNIHSANSSLALTKRHNQPGVFNLWECKHLQSQLTCFDRLGFTVFGLGTVKPLSGGTHAAMSKITEGS